MGSFEVGQGQFLDDFAKNGHNSKHYFALTDALRMGHVATGLRNTTWKVLDSVSDLGGTNAQKHKKIIVIIMTIPQQNGQISETTIESWPFRKEMVMLGNVRDVNSLRETNPVESRCESQSES